MQVYGLNVIDAVYYFLKPHYLELVCHYVVLVLSLVSLGLVTLGFVLVLTLVV